VGTPPSYLLNMVMWHTRAHGHVQGQLAEADMYIRWALPTFHSRRNQSRFYLHTSLTRTRASVQHCFPINSSGGVASHPGYPAQLPCSYITVTLYNSSITLLDRVTALCKARPLDASRHPFQPGPLQATHHGLLKPYKMNTGGTYALSLRVGAP
jgi:hypothetical protein